MLYKLPICLDVTHESATSRPVAALCIVCPAGFSEFISQYARRQSQSLLHSRLKLMRIALWLPGTQTHVQMTADLREFAYIPS